MPRPTIDELETFYNDQKYRENFDTSSMVGTGFAHHRYESLCNVLKQFDVQIASKPNRRLLDVGCGTGDFLQVAQRDGWQVTGTELSATAADKIASRLGIPILTGEITSLQLPEVNYDLITSYHVIEHLIEPLAMLRRLYQLVSNEGAIFLETPNIDSLGARLRGAKWSHIIPPEHITYFQPRSLQYALRQAGFKRVFVFTSAPQMIESTQHLPVPLQSVIKAIYNIAPRLNLGAALQSIAFKD
ncbi:class I SAM-dependent methyltransferase [Nodosilinea sp. LEGE 07298]|uniref:class I SAM-dependent methyltransferase n=1 Tax=Nodosilinea sp. LEGE 07298 TaxID=2777970 RepID=UPI0028BE949A|nr:class I SAM-dependent methyltransferase [Nodosilinea sp. LEGE 07298]